MISRSRETRVSGWDSNASGYCSKVLVLWERGMPLTHQQCFSIELPLTL